MNVGPGVVPRAANLNLGRGAVRAQTEDLQDVARDRVAVPTGCGTDPRLVGFDRDSSTAVLADQVVPVPVTGRIDAEQLAAGTSDGVDGPTRDQSTETVARPAGVRARRRDWCTHTRVGSGNSARSDEDAASRCARPSPQSDGVSSRRALA